jgi:hypothetical protein
MKFYKDLFPKHKHKEKTVYLNGIIFLINSLKINVLIETTFIFS